ncbi:PRELI domain-containing protein 1, mitochondrial-like [Gigantopelta aegis]|uniref:PRELI domain-containing protein 1, mitochondrial-like n=1 Tax=Gigantopelta aegis TaxID=1735272 RepID=UPI001B88990B|nr:PRELI domain-containing protein 1, mitochondrial-like [Gigantopelta aegis]
MKFFTISSVFKFSWDQVASAFWQRYPNPYSKHVLSEDVVNREISSGLLYSTRLITKTNPLPRWGERFVPGPRHVCVLEESIVDPCNKTITTYTRNIGMQRVMTVEERCVYKVDPENTKWTVCERSTWVSSSIYGFGRAIQAFGMDRIKKNSVKASKGYEYILEKLYVPETIPEQTLHRTDKLKEAARKAAEVAAAKAKSKTRPILASPSQMS